LHTQLAAKASVKHGTRYAKNRDYNPGILNPGHFRQSRIPGLAAFNPEISGLQKLVKLVLFCMLHNANKNFRCLNNKIFHVR